MVPQENPEDDITKPLIDQNQNGSLSQPLETRSYAKLSIPTPIGPTDFNMSFIFSLLVSFGALLFAGTVWYIMSSADYIFFVWHPTLMSMVLLMATQGNN